MSSVDETASTQLVTQREAAAALGVSTGTVGRWARLGLIPAIVLPSGRRRYRLEDVRACLQIGKSA